MSSAWCPSCRFFTGSGSGSTSSPTHPAFLELRTRQVRRLGELQRGEEGLLAREGNLRVPQSSPSGGCQQTTPWAPQVARGIWEGEGEGEREGDGEGVCFEAYTRTATRPRPGGLPGGKVKDGFCVVRRRPWRCVCMPTGRQGRPFGLLTAEAKSRFSRSACKRATPLIHTARPDTWQRGTGVE